MPSVAEMNLAQFCRYKSLFVEDVLAGILTERVRANPELTPHLMQVLVERLQEIGIGGGYA
jgi:hypothetical protein